MIRAITLILLVMLLSVPAVAQNWQDQSLRHTLRNNSIEAVLQAGMLCGLKDRATGRVLVATNPRDLPAGLLMFGTTPLDMTAAKVTQKAGRDSVQTTIQTRDGDEWGIEWKLDADTGDLVVRSVARTRSPVDEMRYLIPGCDIKGHALVWVHAYGVGHTANAPWDGTFLGDPSRDGSPMGFPHPLVALFQGRNGGFFIEGRDERIGPAAVMVKGAGNTATLGFVRRFPTPTREPAMYEIRIRAYQKTWESAVDPYVKWLEDGAGFVAFDKLPPAQAWVGKLKTQAYIGVGDYEGLEQLAKHVNPDETFVGRQGEMRNYSFDVGYPDYKLSDAAKQWTTRARELGFHVGMHFNCKSVSIMFPELVERFKPGMNVTGKDANGNEQYESIYSGENTLYRVSAAFKPWRDHLVAEIRHAVEAGVDVIYLDEAMSPGGKFMVDGVDGYQGLFLLMKEILEAYPHVAVETEQFNNLTGKYGKLALSQMPLGHPLSGYIYQRYIKVVPEGLMYSPTDSALMDAFDVWGFMLPGADTMREESWLEMAAAMHKYDLVADARLPRKQVTKTTDHYTHGGVPTMNGKIPPEGEKLFGFTGANGVTAYLEKHPTKRGLVVYETGKDPQWFGTRHGGIRSYAGAGVPAYFGFREKIRDWLIYDDKQILGLDPAQTYWFDTSITPSPTRFHVFKVPDDFGGATNMESRTGPQEVGPKDAYFVLRMSGHGEIGVYVPEDHDAYLDGVKLQPNPQTRHAVARINAEKPDPSGLGYHIELSTGGATGKTKEKGPAVLIAFRRADVELNGAWLSLPWYGSADAAKWISGNSAGNGFDMNVGSVGRIIGRVPDGAKRVRATGSYEMKDAVTGFPGDGVIRVNGKEILRIPHGGKPFKEFPFDVDLTPWAGQHILLEFTADGPVRAASATWNNPMFVVE